jgi:hypothetical protein
MAADFRDACNKMVGVIADSNGGLVEHREDLGVVAKWNAAIHNAEIRLALVKFAADVGEVDRKLLPRAPFARYRLRILKNFLINIAFFNDSRRSKLV